MKRIFLVGIVCQYIIISLSAQPTQQELRGNLQKYWYYRNRLANFVVVSPNAANASTEAGTNSNHFKNS